MGWYAWVLASSNYFAPVICGFINDGMGYKWPFFFMAIFGAVAFVFLFLFMEETNYDRAVSNTGDVPPSTNEAQRDKYAADVEGVPATHQIPVPGKEKTFLQKLSLKDSPRPFLMHWRARQSLRLLAWPNIFFAGFSYGTYLIWFNILNATASIILGGAPYNFKPSIVGLSYIACLVGVILGCV